jgi:hypothetical protein
VTIGVVLATVLVATDDAGADRSGALAAAAGAWLPAGSTGAVVAAPSAVPTVWTCGRLGSRAV